MAKSVRWKTSLRMIDKDFLVFYIPDIMILKAKTHDHFFKRQFCFWIRKRSYVLQKMMQKNENDKFQLWLKKLDMLHYLSFWLMKIYSNYETLFFKTATFTESGTSLNKRLTFVTPMNSVAGSFVRLCHSQSKYLKWVSTSTWMQGYVEAY